MDNGAELYRRYLDGDETGFNALLTLYHDALICFIGRYVRNFAAAEDLAADTFVELLVHPKRYSFKSSFKTYLFAVARHKAVDYLRREGRHQTVSWETLSESDAEFETLENAVLADEQRGQIRRAVDSLHDDYAAYLRLSIFEAMTDEEIARILQKSKKQMTNLAFRAREALRKILEKEGIAP